MKRIIVSALAAAALFSAGLAQAAGADLSIKGKLQTGARNVTVSNGGVFDAGSQKSSWYDVDANVSFTTTNVQLTVTCTTPTRFGLHLEDNRADSRLPVTRADWTFGLGMAGGKMIGYFTSSMGGRTSGGQPIDVVYRFNSSTPWLRDLPSWNNGREFLVSFTEPGGTQPAAFDQISTTLLATGYINNLSNKLDYSQEIELDGSATLELVYL